MKQLMQIAIALTLVAGCAMDRETQVDELFADYAGPGMPGAAVMVISNGEPVLIRTYGLARVEDAVAVTAATNFRLASITKQFTATSVLMLLEDDQFELDESIRRTLPELPAYADAITIRMLLQHTSGIADYEPLVDVEFPDQVHDSDVLRLLQDTDSTYFPPGSEYRYSNSGYALLALLVERVSGLSFATFLERNIFAPLEMDGSVAYEAGISTVPNRALGYSVDAGSVTNTDQSAYSAVLGDGGIYTSLNDLFKWDQSLYTDRLLRPETRQLAWTPGLEDYGFGWRIDEFAGHLRYHHAGSTSGFRNFMQQFPESRLSVIVLTNRADPVVDPLGEQVARLYLR